MMETGALISSLPAAWMLPVSFMTESETSTEPGMKRIAWPFEGFAFLGLMTVIGMKEGSCLARHMWLGKYL